MTKPTGWWTTHPTMLTITVAGSWDSNGDGIGDFEGIRQHLDDLEAMGVSGLRLQQVTRFDDDYEFNGLVSQDWFDVDPLYGTMADFDRLMAECRERDIAIIVMAVPEYLGWHHPDYLAAKKAREEGVDDPRVGWFGWEDDGTVELTWDHPGPDAANPAYVEAYLEHVRFWMDKGIVGWDVDSIESWKNLNVDALRAITGNVVKRGGFITAEHSSLEHDITRWGGFNAGTGIRRDRLYRELEAMLEGDADYIRRGLAQRRQLIEHGMFPFQQFGNRMFERYRGLYMRQMFRLQVAFNAALPDQVWVVAGILAYPRAQRTPLPAPLDVSFWGIRVVNRGLDHAEIERQESDPSSPYRFFKRMFALRASEPALGIGELDELPTDTWQTVFAGLRTSEDGTQRAVTMFNFSEEPCRVVVTVGEGIGTLRNYLSGEVVPVEGDTLTVELGRYGFKLFEVTG